MPTESGKPVYPEPQHFPEAHDEAGEILPPEQIAPPEPHQPPGMVYMPPEVVPHVEHSYSPERFACARCGSKNLARGMIVDYGEKFEQVRFAPKRITLSWLNSLFNLRPWRPLLKLEAVACRDCGAVLLVVDPEALRHAEGSRE